MKPTHLQEESTRVLAALRRLARDSGRVRTGPAIDKLCLGLGLPRVDVYAALRDLYRAKLLGYTPDGQELPASGFISVQAEVVVPAAHETAWTEALDAAGLEQDVAAALVSLAAVVADLDHSDMAVLVQALKRLRLGQVVTNDAGFNVSARSLMGSSKVLAALPRQILEALGLPARLQLPSPRYILCAGPTFPVATLLIENPRAFENAVRSGLAKDVAVVCTFGFGLSYLGSALWSDDVHSDDRPIALVREGAPPALDRLLAAERVYFWADLDLAAMGIYRSLKVAIPRLRMSAIYEVMLPMLDDPTRSHPYGTLFDKGGQLGRFGSDVTSPLAAADRELSLLQLACARRAVDQEAVDEQSIREFGALAFTAG